MGNNGRNVFERMAEDFKMTASLPEDVDLEDPAIKAFIDSMPTPRKNTLLTLVSDPDVRRFASVFNDGFCAYLDKICQAKAQGKKQVFIPFNCSPEIFYAMDMVPIGVEIMNTMGVNLEEGINQYLDLSVERGLPDTMCTAQRGLVGMLEAGIVESPDLLVNGALGSCDPNSKVFEYISEKFGIPVCYLDIPFYHDQRALDYYTVQYKKLVGVLEEYSGNKLDEDRLREVCELSNRSTELILEISDLKRNIPNPVPNQYNLNHLATKLTMSGTPEAVAFYETALEVCEELLAKGAHVRPQENIRLMMIYTGVYFDNIIHLWFQEEVGVSYVMDLLLFYDSFPIIDTTNVDTMLEGLAKGMFNLPMTRQLKGEWNMPTNWLQDVLFYVDTYKADCLVFTGHSACKQVWGIYRLVADEVRRQLGTPSLRLEADGWDSRATPMSVIQQQLSDFFETLG
jgi:hypothetical protein